MSVVERLVHWLGFHRPLYVMTAATAGPFTVVYRECSVCGRRF